MLNLKLNLIFLFLGWGAVLLNPAAQAQQPAEQPLVEFRTTGVAAELKKDPRDPQAYLLEIPSNSRIDILYPKTGGRVDPDQWYEVRYLDETGWLRGDEIETVVIDAGL